MTTDLMPAEPATPKAATEPARRILSITTNLLPVEIVDARRQRKVRRIVLAVLIIFVIWLGAWYGQARYQVSAARASLSAAENDLQRLQRQQNAYADVVATQAESQAINSQLASLFAGDLQWSRLFSALQEAAPAGVQVTGVFAEYKPVAVGPAGAAGAKAAGNPSAAARAAGTPGQKPIGALTVTGSGSSKPIVAAYVDALAKVPGLANPLLSDLALLNGVLAFTVRFDITESALGGRYTSKSSSPSGVN